MAQQLKSLVSEFRSQHPCKRWVWSSACLLPHSALRGQKPEDQWVWPATSLSRKTLAPTSERPCLQVTRQSDTLLCPPHMHRYTFAHTSSHTHPYVTYTYKSCRGGGCLCVCVLVCVIHTLTPILCFPWGNPYRYIQGLAMPRRGIFQSSISILEAQESSRYFH